VKLHLVGTEITTSEEGTHVLKGVPDEWRMFAVGARDTPTTQPYD
jgi:hypothetical protein